RVVAARLYDAKFFYEEDLKQPLEAYVSRLDEVVFQETLGTMRDKTERVVKLSARLVAQAGLAPEEMRDIARAAYLAKADLVTGAVVEFTSVQGIMGSYYAAAAGEPERVARAIAEHYRPRFSGDAIPADVIGQVVALSDKIDTICGLFAVGQAPTGSSDPFALRRAALGVLAILEETGLPISLVETIDASLIIYREAGLEFDNASVRREIIDFFITREKVALRDAGVKADTIDAVLASCIEEPMVLAARARALEAARTHEPEVFADLATAFARANNLREIGLGTGYKTAELTAVERDLSDAVEAAEEAVAAALREDRFADALTALAALRAPVDRFFETTMVMDEDAEVRANRLKLLNRFANVFSHVADFGQMAKK
uniref:glycine--tRNA ligase subunit beta n=1 Tax=Adlercreutzia caecimuris TaxID=671266 RepID=UPI00256FCDDF